MRSKQDFVDPPTNEACHVVRNAPKPDRRLGWRWAKDRDRGEPRGSAPPTPPYVRVRIRRFEKVTLTRVDQGREAERFEVGIGESHREGFAPGEMPGATAATGHVAQLPRDSQCD